MINDRQNHNEECNTKSKGMSYEEFIAQVEYHLTRHRTKESAKKIMKEYEEDLLEMYNDWDSTPLEAKGAITSGLI